MKKLILIAGIGASLLMASCSGNQKKVDEDSARIADLTAEYQQATNFNDSLMLLMGDIYTGLDSINTQEGLLYNMTTGEGGDRRGEIRNNLSQIKARLAANKKLLEEMEAKVNSSDKNNSVQARTIAQLRQHIEQQDAKIKQLEAQLSSAKAEIDTLHSTVARTQEQVKQETAAKEQAQAAAEDATKEANEANKVYYAIGSNKELKKKGLLEKKFLGSTKVLKGQFDASYFQVADKRTLKSIPTGSKKVKMWTNMPAGSYRIVGEKDGPKTIEITDPNKFWSLSTHCVIQID